MQISKLYLSIAFGIFLLASATPFFGIVAARVPSLIGLCGFNIN